LFLFGLVVLALQGWMMVEAFLVWPKAKGVLEEKLPPLEKNSKLAASGGRSC
jgi:carbon starvation protein